MPRTASGLPVRRSAHRLGGLARVSALAAPLALTALLGGCASYLQRSDSLLGVVTPYRIDIVQGNVVTKEQLERVKPGMRRDEVREALGSPLLTDIFHGDRWDYVFTIRRQGTEPQRRHVQLQFDGDVLKTVESTPLPAEREFVDSITSASNKAHGTLPDLELSEAQRAALPKPAARPPEAAAAGVTAPGTPPRTYPPLEATP